MIVCHDTGRRIDVRPDRGVQVAWALDYGSKPKPFVHPLRTPAGHTLSLVEPHDHLWHRGLWFTFKFVNGDNFWEEREPFGRQVVRGIPAITHAAAESVTVAMGLDWVRPGEGEVVLTEERTIGYRDEHDARILDWTTVITAGEDVVLDRTPYTTWGGYGGLSFRASRHWHVDRYLLPDGGAERVEAGKGGEWCELSGPLDGGTGLSAGLAILDHPENPRHPTPWYAGGGAFAFVNAALLFHEPLALARGDTLSLRYRILVHDGIWDAERLAGEHARFATQAVATGRE